MVKLFLYETQEGLVTFESEEEKLISSTKKKNKL